MNPCRLCSTLPPVSPANSAGYREPTKNLVMRLVFLSSLLLLGSCGYSVRLPYIYEGDAGQELQAGETGNFMFFTNDARADSGIALLAGMDYDIAIAVLSNWTDGNIDTNENGDPLDITGFADSLMPGFVPNALKRSDAHRWFELMLYQDNCPGESLRGITQLPFAPATGLYTYRAFCSGKLSMHVNDAWGFYNNNAGYANVSITRH